MSGNEDAIWFRFIVGGVFTAVGIVLAWLQVQISQVRQDARQDKEDLRRELLDALKALSDTSDMQHTALKDDVKKLYDRAEKQWDETVIERRRMLDALGVIAAKQAALPDRNEVQSTISALRLDVNTLVKAMQKER
jgi:hypothetical protein